MSDTGTSDFTTVIQDLGQVADTGLQVYTQDQLDQINLQRLQNGSPPLPISYFGGNVSGQAPPPATFGPLGPSPTVPMGLNPMLLLLIGLGVFWAMSKR